MTTTYNPDELKLADRPSRSDAPAASVEPKTVSNEAFERSLARVMHRHGELVRRLAEHDKGR